MLVLKNYPWDVKIATPIVITEKDSEWEEAYKLWVSGKMPTKDERWKAGVFMGTV